MCNFRQKAFQGATITDFLLWQSTAIHLMVDSWYYSLSSDPPLVVFQVVPHTYPRFHFLTAGGPFCPLEWSLMRVMAFQCPGWRSIRRRTPVQLDGRSSHASPLQGSSLSWTRPQVLIITSDQKAFSKSCWFNLIVVFCEARQWGLLNGQLKQLKWKTIWQPQPRFFWTSVWREGVLVRSSESLSYFS